MASYTELRQMFNHGDLLNRVKVACIVAAEQIRNESASTANHSNRLKWAKQAFVNPDYVGSQMLMALLAANKDATTSQITNATDATIQENVDAAINVFADGS